MKTTNAVFCRRSFLCRAGISLLEVLVAIGIIALLVAITVPAVQASRETANRTKCGAQLRQLAIAAESYSTVHSVYPGTSGIWPIQLATYVEANPNQPIISSYACPSDREHATGEIWNGHLSYAMNDGHGKGEWNGVVGRNGNPVSSGEIIDGLSNTAMFSERLSYPWFSPQVVDWQEHQRLWNRVPLRFFHDSNDIDELADDCTHYSGEPAASWYFTEVYHHVLPPNGNSCMLYPSNANPTPRFLVIVTASSPHDGRTQTVFCDGSLRSVSNSIDLSVWQAIGSRNGGEPNANTAF